MPSNAAAVARPVAAVSPALHAPGGTFAALAGRDFRFLLGGTMAANLASWVQMVAQGWLVLDLTGSAVALGVISFVRGIAMLLASPIGGLLADRFDRRVMMNLATGASAAAAALLAVLVIADLIQVWQLVALAAVDGLLSSVNMPARTALVYDVAGKDRLTNAVALQSIGQNLTRLIGPSLGGALLGIAGVGVCFAVQAACYAISVAVSLPIRTKPAEAPRLASLAESVLGGVRYARSKRSIILLLIVAALPSLLVYPYMSFMPLFARDVLHTDATWFGILITAVGVGSIAGALLAARKAATFPHKGQIMLGLTALYMLMVGAFALSEWYALSYLLLVVAGFANAIYLTLNSSLLQFATPDEFRGRINGLYFMTSGLQPFGSLALGACIGLFGAQPSVALFCFLAAAITLALWVASPRLRRM